MIAMLHCLCFLMKCLLKLLDKYVYVYMSMILPSILKEMFQWKFFFTCICLMAHRKMAPRFASVNAGQTQPQEDDKVAIRATGPRNITRGTGARAANRRTNMGDIAGSSHPQWVIDEVDPTICEMTQNANPTM